MTEAAFYQPGHRSPTALTMVILLHGAAIGALALTKMNIQVKQAPPPPIIFDVPIDREPDPIPPEPIEDVKPRNIDQFERIVPTPPPQSRPELDFPRTETTFTKAEPVTVEPEAKPEPQPRPEPVRRDARIDPRSELKPPYPRAQQIEGNEGSVTVRVRIGPDGRVRGAEKIRATHDDFFQATLRHALRNWRFKPATVDGRPIESSKVMTLHFTLEGEG